MNQRAVNHKGMNGQDERLLELRVQSLEAELSRQKAPPAKTHFWANPAILAILGAVCTASFGLVTNEEQLNASRQLERDKMESSLILKAIDSSDAEQRISALKFLVKAGLISDHDKKIDELKLEDVPRIKNTPAPTKLTLGANQESTGESSKSPNVPVARN
jgi:hypothetical protein